jgi:hypothetical protein
MAVLIDRPPEIMALTLNGQKDLIQVPLVSWSGLSAPELIRMRLPKLAAPLPNRFVSHRDTACKQQFFDIAIAEGSSTLNRGHEHHRSTRHCKAREGRPRRLGGVQRDGGT